MLFVLEYDRIDDHGRAAGLAGFCWWVLTLHGCETASDFNRLSFAAFLRHLFWRITSFVTLLGSLALQSSYSHSSPAESPPTHRTASSPRFKFSASRDRCPGQGALSYQELYLITCISKIGTISSHLHRSPLVLVFDEPESCGPAQNLSRTRPAAAAAERPLGSAGTGPAKRYNPSPSQSDSFLVSQNCEHRDNRPTVQQWSSFRRHCWRCIRLNDSPGAQSSQVLTEFEFE